LTSLNINPSSEVKNVIIQKVKRPRSVCEELGICRTTLWKLQKSGELVPIQLGARAIGYRAEDVQAFIDSRPMAGWEGGLIMHQITQGPPAAPTAETAPRKLYSAAQDASKTAINQPLSEVCRKRLYMELYHGGVIGPDVLSWAFARNSSWRAA
jgi:predicted DNA-binding transcriptional regulator AlpA